MLVNVMSFDYDLDFIGCKATTHNLSNGPVDETAIVVYDRQDGSDPRIDFDANPAHYTAEDIAAHQQRFIALLHQLVEEYQYRLVRYLIYLTGRRDYVDDIVQDTWLRLSMVLPPSVEADIGWCWAESHSRTSNQDSGRLCALVSAPPMRSVSTVLAQTNP